MHGWEDHPKGQSFVPAGGTCFDAGCSAAPLSVVRLGIDSAASEAPRKKLECWPLDARLRGGQLRSLGKEGEEG